MAPYMKKYPIGPGRIRRAWKEGFTALADGRLQAAPYGRRIVFFGRIDSSAPDCPWGRMRFDARLTGDAAPVVRAFASNEPGCDEKGAPAPYDKLLLGADTPAADKLRLFEAADCTRAVGKTDLLLYKQNGRFLWLCVEIIGDGDAVLGGFEVFSPRDNFINTFPEIYRRDSDFFHRYLSIFSSVYYDIQETIDALPAYADADTAPYEALPVLAGWLGLELRGGFLDEKHLRRLVREAFSLIRKKGTRAALEQLLAIFVDEPFYIMEQRILLEGLSGEYRRTSERLYGSSPYQIVVILNRPPDERLSAQLRYLISRFIPARCRLKLVFLEPGSRADSYCYMDVNACITGPAEGRLDGGTALDGLAYLPG